LGIGARVWKTAVAVGAALGLSAWLGLEHPVFAGVAAVICMQPTVAGSLRSGKERMQATVIGAAFSLLALILLEHTPALQPVRPAFVGFTVLLVMAVTIRLRWFDSLVLAAATVVVIMVLPSDENIYRYSASRTLVTFIGIVVATAVNALFLAPHYREPLWQRLRQLVTTTDQIYRQAVEAFCLRKLALAMKAQAALAQSEQLQRAVLTRMQWLDEETRLRRAIHWREEKEVDVLRGAVEAVSLVRRSAGTVAEVAQQVLTRRPEYADEPARVYEMLWDLAQVSFAILGQVESRLSGDATQVGDTTPTWGDEMHRCLIKAIHAAYAGPRDVFPLVEVSVVAFEIRRATEAAGELADVVFGRGG
jgi:uncharacterized membrane protein YgaE (UPF0421/DUF939 family)